VLLSCNDSTVRNESCSAHTIGHYSILYSLSRRSWERLRLNKTILTRDAVFLWIYIGKGKGRPRTGHEGPEGELRYSLTPSLTSALDGGGWSTPHPGRFTPERPGTHCIGGWDGPRAGLDGCGKSRPLQGSIPGPSSP